MKINSKYLEENQILKYIKKKSNFKYEARRYPSLKRGSSFPIN